MATSTRGSVVITKPSSSGSLLPTATGNRNGSPSPTTARTGTSIIGGAAEIIKVSAARRFRGISVLLGLGVFAAGLATVIA